MSGMVYSGGVNRYLPEYVGTSLSPSVTLFGSNADAMIDDAKFDFSVFTCTDSAFFDLSTVF